MSPLELAACYVPWVRFSKRTRPAMRQREKFSSSPAVRFCAILGADFDGQALAMARQANGLVVGVAALCLLATHAFVSSSCFVVGGTSPVSGRHSPRISSDGNVLDFQAFQPRKAEGAESVASWSSILAIAVAFGLVAGVTSSPVRAEEVVSKQAALDELKKSVDSDVSTAATPNIMMSTKAIKVNAKTKVKEEGKASPTSPSVSSSSGGSESVKSTVLNPSDDVDDDELGFDEWTVRNPLLFLFFALIPTFIYLFFWVAGSLEIL